VVYRGAISRSMLFLMSSLSALLGGCGKTTQGEANERRDAAPISGTRGAWEWVQTTGGSLGDTMTPGSSGRSYRLQVLTGERYRQTSSADGVSDGMNTSASGYTFNEPDVVVSVLRFDQPLFNGYFGPVDAYAVFVRGDTLELTDTSSHPWEHRYVRAPDHRTEP
jgi:hypothetical protein